MKTAKEPSRIGDITVGSQGFGAMGISEFYGRTDERQALHALEAALDLGVTYIDTADMYGNGHNEQFLGSVIAGRRGAVVIGTKFGIVRDIEHPTRRGIDNSERYIRHSVEASLTRLGVDVIDVYYMHRKDPRIPVAETVGVMANLVAQGKIREIGLSEVTAQELEEAHREHRIGAVQTEWSLLTRDAENQVVPQAASLGIAVVAYSPLSRGLLTEEYPAEDSQAEDVRSTMPRFSADNLQHNRDLLAPLRQIADARGATISQIALAWLHARPKQWNVPVIPIPGTRTPERVRQNVEAAGLELAADELALLEPLHIHVAGDRYPDLSFTYLTRESPKGTGPASVPPTRPRPITTIEGASRE